MNTASFKTRTIFTERKNESVDNYWTIALDIGYSAVKGFSNNMIYCFPSYARKITSPMLNFGDANFSDIQYKDNTTGEIWAVGEAAQNMIFSDETKDSVESLYGRNRYYSDMFKVIARVGMALGMIKNKFGDPTGKPLILQTGLPPKYIKSDSEMLKDALAGTHDFSIKRGSKPWISFSFSLPQNNIFIMAQPMGTLFSIATDNKGNQIPEAKKYFKSNMLIFDPGFGTLDTFNIRNSTIASSETRDDLGMKRVLSETVAEIYNLHKQEVSVPAMQKYLEKGTIMVQDRKNRISTNVPFGNILEQANKKICFEALKNIDSLYNGLFDHDYLVVTGGTGAAWNAYIKEYYKGLSNLTIIPGNQNDNIPYIFSNVRGYYLYLISRLKRSASTSN